MKLFIPICKIDEAQRLVYGTLSEEVPDKAGEMLDYASAKPEFERWSQEFDAATKGKSKGNLRSMHSGIAAGKFTEISFDDDNRRIEGCAKVIDDAEWEKVREGVYTGFSIGGSYKKRWKDESNPHLMRFTPELQEISLVDNPCCPTSTFSVVKTDGTTEIRKFHHHKETQTMTETPAPATEAPSPQEEPSTAVAAEAATEGEAAPAAKSATEAQQLESAAFVPVQKWVTPDGQAFVSKKEAVAHIIEMQEAEKTAPIFEALKAAQEAIGNGSQEATAVEKREAASEDGNKEATPAPLQKGLHGIAHLAYILAQVNDFQQSTEYERASENDDSTMPEQLKAWLKQGTELLTAYVAEETSELFEPGEGDVDVVMQMAAGLSFEESEALARFAKSDAVKEALTKAGPRHSKADRERLGDVHDSAEAHLELVQKCMKDMGMKQESEADEGAAKMAGSQRNLLEKLTESEARNAALEKSVAKLNSCVPLVTELLKRVKHLEAQPMPPKGAVKAIAKADDHGSAGDGGGSESGETDTKDPMALMKAALNRPIHHTRN